MYQHQPSVLITETRICGRDVLKPLEKVMEAFKELKVIVYSAQEDSTHIARAAALGCYEYLPKTVACERLVAAICCAIAGQPTPSGQFAENDAFQSAPPKNPCKWQPRHSIDQP